MISRRGRQAWLCASISFMSLIWTNPSFAKDPSQPSEAFARDLQPLATQTTPSDPAAYYQHIVRRSAATVDTVRYWNQVAIDASGIDHTPVQPGETRKYGEQLGPGRAARAMAIVHIAMFDAANSILGGYRSYTGIPKLTQPANVDAAVAVAAHDALLGMYPSQGPAFKVLLQKQWALLPSRSTPAMQRGIETGVKAAAAILKLRKKDHSEKSDPKMDGEWLTSEQPYHWRQDPIGLAPIALGAYWGQVTPFVMASATQFRTPAPPPMTSPEYTAAYDEVKALGGDGIHTPTSRTPDQTHIGIFWAYDGTPSLCAPPRLYNQVATTISSDKTDVMEVVRLYALLNTAMADAGIASWESKFYWDVWRPVTGIRESDEGTGPSALGDGNPATIGDPHFWPLGAPASNLSGVDFTPPFPSYPSGHATFGGTVFQILRKIYGTDNVPFTFTSDEFNGETVGSGGQVRPLLPRSYGTLSEAEEENGQSRIYLGIHWSFDKTSGIAQGRQIADYVYANAFQKLN
jgi:hypothetical protein